VQSEAALGELTVREIVTHFSAYYPNPRDPGEVIAAVGLTGQAGDRLRRLSGGQRRRVDVVHWVLALQNPTPGT
jgi:ABC-2 type transport system ATP-binding protein